MENPVFPNEYYVDDIPDQQELERLSALSGWPMSILSAPIVRQSFAVPLAVLSAAIREAKVLLCQTTPAITWKVVEDNGHEEQHFIQVSGIGDLMELRLWEPEDSTASMLMITDRTSPPRGWTEEEKTNFGAIPSGQERRRAMQAAAAAMQADREHYKQGIGKWQNVVLSALHRHLSTNSKIRRAMQKSANGSTENAMAATPSLEAINASEMSSEELTSQERFGVLSADMAQQPARRRRGGPKSVPEPQKRAYIEGWLSVQEHELQDVYCKREGISVSALREWMKDLGYS